MRLRARHVLIGGVALAAGYFAVFGGEYNLFEVQRLEGRAEEERARIDSLQLEVDSLAARADSLERDSATLERIARERYGMIRDGERLYRFAGEDSTRSDEREAGTGE